MNEPTDPKQSDSDDKDLSSLYARGSTEQPSDALDKAILEKARKATARHAARTHRFSGWPRAVSAAAVLVLSVLVVTVIHEEEPEPLSIAGRSAVVEKDKALPAPAEKFAKRSKAEAPAPVSPVTESEEAPRAFADRLALNEEKDQRQRPAGKGAVGNAITAAPATAPAQEPMAAGIARGDVQQDKAAPTPSTALPASPEQLAERDAAAPAAEGASPSNTLNRLLVQKGETDQPSLEEEAPRLAGAAADTMASGVAGSDVQKLTSEEKECARMPEQECFSSAACTLTKNQTGSGYQCRYAKDHCELMFRQSEGTRESCEAKTGCAYVPASCYCPPDVKCDCSGGEPAQCQKRLGSE